MAKWTSGPWHTCNDGKCSCFTVMADHHPIAQVTHGPWGDDYPAIRIVGPSLDAKAEAYMEQITYGEIADERARANWRLLAAAPELFDACRLAVAALGNADAARHIAALLSRIEGAE